MVEDDPLPMPELEGLLEEPLALEGLELDGLEELLLPAPELMPLDEPEVEPEPLFSLFSCFSHSE